MNGLLALDPQQRTSAEDALSHVWFTTEKPPPTPLGDMPQAREGNKGGVFGRFVALGLCCVVSAVHFSCAPGTGEQANGRGVSSRLMRRRILVV